MEIHIYEIAHAVASRFFLCDSKPTLYRLFVCLFCLLVFGVWVFVFAFFFFFFFGGGGGVVCNFSLPYTQGVIENLLACY